MCGSLKVELRFPEKYFYLDHFKTWFHPASYPGMKPGFWKLKVTAGIGNTKNRPIRHA
jgi:hypothetical protein